MGNSLEHFGQHFIVGIEKESLSAREVEILKRLSPLGIILFAKNFASENWIENLEKLKEDLIEASGRRNLLLAIDHEGGRVHRFPNTVTHFPYARNYSSRAFDVGVAMGRELRALGFSLNFAPVLDKW